MELQLFAVFPSCFDGLDTAIDKYDASSQGKGRRKRWYQPAGFKCSQRDVRRDALFLRWVTNEHDITFPWKTELLYALEIQRKYVSQYHGRRVEIRPPQRPGLPFCRHMAKDEREACVLHFTDCCGTMETLRSALAERIPVKELGSLVLEYYIRVTFHSSSSSE